MPLYMMYLDLAELPSILDRIPLHSSRRIAPAWWRRKDYVGNPEMSIDASVRTLVHEQTGRTPSGPIRMLAHLRIFGYCFNPVTFYYCFDLSGRVESIVAEITNTPWKERHAYVLPVSDVSGRVLRFHFEKEFHISPFMPMSQRYDWTFARPGERLGVHMRNVQSDGRIFDATLAMRRHELTAAAAVGALLRFPFMTMQVIGRIHFEALRLYLKRIPVHVHPGASTNVSHLAGRADPS